ncbi:FAD-binding protein [Chloroflexota bacterium]
MASQSEIVYRYKLPKWNKEADVVVVGYGGAGAATAITAHDDGAKVIIIEKLPADIVDEHGNIVEIRHHPSSLLSAAGIYTPTNAEDAYRYQAAINQVYGHNDVPDDMVRAWSELVCQNFDWLKALKGGEIFEYTSGTTKPEFPDLPGAGSHGRVSNPQHGYGWFRCLSRNVEDRGIEVLYDTPAKELVQNPETKEILGVICEHDGEKVAVKAKRGVVLTCGGFEFNMEMQSNYLRIWPFRFYCNPGNTGDGVTMAQKVGAALWHMNNVSAHFGIAWVPGVPTGFHCGFRTRGEPEKRHIDRDGNIIPRYESAYSFIITDKHGRRFGPDHGWEGHSDYWIHIQYNSKEHDFPRIPCHLIFDEKERIACPQAGNTVFGHGWFGSSKMGEWSRDNSEEIAKGWIKKGNTLRELAEQIDVPAENLEESVARYNELCKQGKDSDFGRKPETLVPVDTPPYYEMTKWPGGPNTQGGAKRNKDCQIVDTDNKPIPRLYSGGEFGSMFNFTYQGGSNTSECIVTGRIAGKNAAAEKPWS